MEYDKNKIPGHDFKSDSFKSRSKPKRKIPLIRMLILAGIVTGIIHLVSPGEPDTKVLDQEPREKISVPEKEKDEAIRGKIKYGMTFSSMMTENGLNCCTFSAFYKSLRNSGYKTLMTGDSFVIHKTPADTLIRISIRNSQRVWYIAEQTDTGITAYVKEPVFEIREEVVTGTLENSLYMSMLEIGEKPELIVRFSDIFAWDVNFFLDPREGDIFEILLEKYYDGREFVKYGKILAARYHNQGELHSAFLFEDADAQESYYDAEGGSVRKRFLKAPLHYTRISSKFTYKRFHPILKRYRAHPAVDYAAPTGTPVYAACDGKVVYRKKCGGYGKTVCLRHGGGYKTYYGHLSRYAGIAPGKYVKQGDCIGYVGSTGLSTGPHLDYRVEKDGRYINPLTIKSPRNRAVPKEKLEAFKKVRDSRITRFSSKQEVQV